MLPDLASVGHRPVPSAGSLSLTRVHRHGLTMAFGRSRVWPVVPCHTLRARGWTSAAHPAACTPERARALRTVLPGPARPLLPLLHVASVCPELSLGHVSWSQQLPAVHTCDSLRTLQAHFLRRK